MKIFKQNFSDDGFFKPVDGISFSIEEINRGIIIRGSVSGSPGRVEVVRLPAIFPLMINSWESWGPCEWRDKDWRYPWTDSQYEDWRYTASLVPDILKDSILSDYFVVWGTGLAGFLSSEYAHGFFTVEGDELVGYLDYFDRNFSEPVELEPLVIIKGNNPYSSLDRYGELIKKENSVKIRSKSPIGWCSWYHYFLDLTWPDIEKNLKLARDWDFSVFQVDDAYEKDIGDWLSVKDGFPSVEDMGRTITKSGYEAGIWTAPFCISSTSEVYNTHPDWVVKKDGQPVVAFRNWERDIYALDLSNPEVKKHLYDIFSSLKNYGFSYFKIDFLFAGAVPGERTKAVSPVEAYREGLSVIRKAVGDSFILACGAPLIASVGFVDGMRIGPDTTPFWDSRIPDTGAPAIQYAIRNSINRSFMHKRLWLNDPDCLILRSEKTQLTEDERRTFCRVAGVLDGIIVDSDDLSLVDDKGREMFSEAVSLSGGRPRIQRIADNVYDILSEGVGEFNVLLTVNLSDNAFLYDSKNIEPHSTLLKKNNTSHIILVARTEERDGRHFTYYTDGEEKS